MGRGIIVLVFIFVIQQEPCANYSISAVGLLCSVLFFSVLVSSLFWPRCFSFKHVCEIVATVWYDRQTISCMEPSKTGIGNFLSKAKSRSIEWENKKIVGSGYLAKEVE